MWVMISHKARWRFAEIPMIFVLVSVAISGMIAIPQTSGRIVAAALLIIFAILLFGPFFWRGRVILVHIGLSVLSALTAILMTFRPAIGLFPILFFILAPLAMIYLPIKAGFAWIGVFTFITGTIYVAINGILGLASLLPYAAGYVFFGIFGWMMIEADRNRARSDQLFVELQSAHQQLKDYAARVEELTIAQERNRMAREMHDTLGHRLTIAAVQLEGAQRLIPTNPDKAASIVVTVREQVKEGLTELRQTVAMLRSSVEEDLPLDKALARLVDQVQQAAALKIHLSLEGCPDNLSQPQRQALYRAAQEALTNIQRHAHASEAWVQLTGKQGMISLLISDNGVGISPERAQSGFGLLGLKERAVLQGGEFHVDARPGGGTQITFRIPSLQEAGSVPTGDSGGSAYE